MAAVALERLGLADQLAEVLTPQLMVPQVGQGALAVEVRAGDDELLDLVQSIEDAPSRAVVDVERAFLAELGGGCDLPVGAHATLRGGTVHLSVFLAGGRTAHHQERSAPLADAMAVARDEARLALARTTG